MRLILHNPQSLWFKENLTCFFSKTKSINKYDFIINYLYKHEKKIFVYIDSIYPSPLFNKLFSFLNLPIIDFYAWVILNRLNPLNFKVISNVNKLHKNDIFFTFLYSTFIHADKEIDCKHFIEKIKDKEFLKVVHLSHFGYKTNQASLLTKEAKIDLFISESNLSSSSSYFKHYFNWYDKDVLILPFVAQSRFQKKTAYETRINKVLSTGTNTQKMKEDDFISFFHTDILQPMRSEIIENLDLLKNYIDPMVNNLQSSNKIITHKEKSNFSFFLHFIFSDILRLISLILKGFFNIKLDNLKNESNYYKVDIVEKYNSYKMFIVPEEIIGVPGIGFIEGMNCGCAYIGVDGPMYNDIGMIAGTHFISYDGTIEDLKTKIEYYQKNEKKLKIIAMNGYQFAKNNFGPNQIASSFFKRLTLKAIN